MMLVDSRVGNFTLFCVLRYLLGAIGPQLRPVVGHGCNNFCLRVRTLHDGRTPYFKRNATNTRRRRLNGLISGNFRTPCVFLLSLLLVGGSRHQIINGYFVSQGDGEDASTLALPPQLVAAAIREKLQLDDDNDQDILGEWTDWTGWASHVDERYC